MLRRVGTGAAARGQEASAACQGTGGSNPAQELASPEFWSRPRRAALIRSIHGNLPPRIGIVH
jgi:hypothetical protein